jgi:ATP phosphoribosyltransferase
MKLNGDNLKIAIQKSGRLTESTIDLLKRSGLEFDAYGAKLFSTCRNFPLEILFIRDDDIPEYVQDGVCDLGIVGANIVEETEANVTVVDDLGFGRCRLSLAVPKGLGVKSVEGLNGKRIATSYPTILKQFLAKNEVEATIVPVSGSVEITPSLKIADAICDLVSTGTTLKMNGLEVLETVMETSAVLIGNKDSLLDSKRSLNIDRFLMRIRSTLMARRTKYVMMNAPETALLSIQKILPGLDSPTVVPLAEEGKIAIHAVVPEDTFWDDMERLKEAGATGILVLPIEKMIL